MFGKNGALRLAVVLTASATAWGCGSEDQLQRQAISGSVTLAGKPLESGMIQFQPTSTNETTAGVGTIALGRYRIAAIEGLVPGKYQVMITGALGPPAESKAGVRDEALPRAPAKELIPTRYNSNTELRAEVTKDGTNQFDFDLKAD